MSDPRMPGRALTALVLEVFRLNAELVSTGDALVRDLGLTSARWQVLSAITRSPASLPVAHLARTMGLTRQAVQRVVDDLRKDNLVCLEPNPHHRRAALVAITERGAAAYAAASVRQERWVDELAHGLPSGAVDTAAELLRELRSRMAPPAPAATT